MSATNNEFVAKKMLQNLGGKENIESLECCATRLRVEVKDPAKVDADKIRQMGVKGVVFLTETNLQVVIGTSVQKVKAAMDELL